MSGLGRVAMIVLLALGCLGTLRACTYLLGTVLNVPEKIGLPLVPVVAALIWTVPLFFSPALRAGFGSLRLPLSWTVLLLLPVVALNWTFSMYFAAPVWLPPALCLFLGSHAFAAGVYEELMFRGYAYCKVPEAHPRLVVLASSFCFALAHLPWLSDRPLEAVLRQVIFAAIVGIAFGVIRLVSGSLAWCMLLHGAINAAKPAAVPGLTQWTPYVLIFVGLASLLVMWRHPVFRRGDPDRQSVAGTIAS
ncbi:MAG: CPBP family intramembrane glutamic endopeptidase [Chthoniobacteraceae bacterium]